jgi:YVTN family beta-propeller protein
LKHFLIHILILFFIVFSSCTKEVGKVNYGDYPYEVGKIIVNSCAVSGCHNANSYLAASDFNLSTWKDLFKGSSNGSPVIPYNSKFSSLCYFINTYSDLGIQNTPTMPINKKPLSYEEVKTIRDWIDKGAPDIDGNVMWADNPRRKKMYAVNQGCDVVTVFDAESQLPMRFIQVGNKPSIETPHQIRVSADGNFWYVIFVNNNIMQKFRCSDDSFVANIPLTPFAAGTGVQNDLDWNTFIISKDGKRAYATSLTGTGRVCVVDLENHKLVAYSGILANPHGIALNEAEDKVYVGAQEGNYVTVLDAAFTEAKNIYLDNTSSPNDNLKPHDLLLSEDKKSLLITCQQSNDVRVLNLATEQVTKIISTGVFPQELIYSTSTHCYYVSCTEDKVSFPKTNGVLTRIDANSYITKNIPCGFQPHGMAVDESKKLLYVLSRNISTDGPLPHHTSFCGGRNGFVSFVDLNTFTVLSKRYELSADPYFIFARP